MAIPFLPIPVLTTSIYSFSTSTKEGRGSDKKERILYETRDRFKQMFVYLQSGQYEEAVVTVEKCYAKGYSLPKNDVFFLVSRLTDRKEFALVNRFFAVFESYDEQFIVDHASLFCYTLLLSGDIMKAFSMISSASDQFIAQWNQDHITSSRSPSSPSLPQEYLFVRLCIQMLNDSKGLHGTLSPFAQAIPRRSTSSPESSVHYEEIIMCYLYSWQYLTAALRAKTRNNSVRQLGGDDFGSAASESQSRETLQELFVSPYNATDGTDTTDAARSLETCKFSSFTLQYGDQLLHTTLRSLSLLLWYYYSRSVYQLQRVPASSYVLSPEETIETVFATMRRSFENWSASIFHFFIFFFAQPGAKASPVTAPSMRNCDTVVELLSRMKGRVAMSDALALMLLKKPDLPTDAMAAIMDFYLDENQPKIQLQSQLVEHQELFASYMAAVVRRGEYDRLRSLYRRLRYLSLPITEEVANEILVLACSIEDRTLQDEVVGDMARLGLQLRAETAVCLMYERRDEEAFLTVPRVADKENWKLCLGHLLLQTLSDHNSQVRKYCEEESVVLDSAMCESLFTLYSAKQDYQNVLKLHSAMLERRIAVSREVEKDMEDVVETIHSASSRLFGRGSLLEGVVVTKRRLIRLSRQNVKYVDEHMKQDVKDMMSLFRRDEKSVSINAIVNSAINEFCACSIREYETWL